MKKVFKVFLITLVVALMAGPLMAGPYGGKTGVNYMPARPSTGYVGDSTYPWAYGYFDTLVVNTLLTNTGTTNGDQSYDFSLMDFMKGSALAILTTATDPAIAAVGVEPGIRFASNSTASIVANARRLNGSMTGSSIAWRVLCRFTGSASGTISKALNWGVTVNTDGSAYGGTSTQVSVTIPNVTTASQYVATLTPNAALQASLTAGKWYSLQIAPNSNNAGQSGTLTILGVQAYNP
jgi:hypothetical protein